MIEGLKEIRISSFLAISRLNKLIDEDTQDFISITGKQQMIELGKLRGFMQVNQVVGVVSHAATPTECLVILPVTEVKKLDRLKKDVGIDVSSYTQWCGVWIRHLPVFREISGTDYEFDDEEEDSSSLLLWYKVSAFLKFPKEVKKENLVIHAVIRTYSLANKTKKDSQIYGIWSFRVNLDD